MSSRGSFYSSVAENHQFVTNDPVLLHYGAGSFTLKSIKDILKAIRDDGDNISDEEFYNNYISGKEDKDLKAEILFSDANSGSWIGSQFSSSSNSSTSVSYSFSEIRTLIENFEEKIEDLVLVVDDADKDDQRQKVKDARKWIDNNINVFKNGKDSYLELYGTIFYDANTDGDANTDSDNKKRYYTRLYFSMPGERKNERVIAKKGKMVLSDVGTRATGSKYSFGKSHRVTGGTSSNGTTRHAGLFVPPDSADGSNVNDLASGPLRLSYNDGLGMWESSQTILARLFTNVPAAVNNPFQVPEEKDGLLKSESDAALFYDKGSKYYTGNFTTGLAVPVSCQNRNPHLFGPNVILDEYGDKRIEKIRVVNRTEKDFTAGTIVLCTLVGAEWIVHEFGKSGAGLPTQLGPWTFSKFIANSDHYFRDKDGESPLWDINTYEEKARKKWYSDWISAVADGKESHLGFHDIASIAQANGADSSVVFNPSCGYQTCTSFDSADFFASGVINIDQAIDNSEGFPVGDDLPLFWGPVLPDGYNSRAPSVGADGETFGINSSLYFHSTAFKDTMNIPADMAVNGPYSDDYNTSPILPIDYWQEKINSGGSLYDHALAYRSEVYASPTYINGFGYQPKNPNRIQFSPLTFEMVINTDEDRGGDTDKDTIYEYMRAEYGSDMFGKMFDRYSCVAKQGKQIQYDKKITRKPLSMPYGTWFTLFDQESEPYEGLNLVAVTAGINRFSRPGGGALNIEVSQNFGTTQARTVSGGQAASMSSVAAFFGIVSFNPGSGPTTRGFPQWGSRTDKYNTFGTTALHCRVFDAWPHEDTIWDTRFFSALHFNPNTPDEDGRTSVDFKVPTLVGGGFPSAGTSVTSSNISDYLDSSDWTYDTIRRGKLLTNGGFKYNKLTIGLDPSSVVIAKAGSTAVAGNAESTSLNFKFSVQADANGAVTGILANHYDELGERMDGEGLEADAFGGSYVDDSGNTHTGYILRYADAVLIFQGKVRLVTKQDTGPIQHGGVVRCTSSSNNGEEVVTGVQSSEIGLNPNDTGQYDAYFFFHNDISHTYQDSRWNPFMSPGLQYIIASIS